MDFDAKIDQFNRQKDNIIMARNFFTEYLGPENKTITWSFKKSDGVLIEKSIKTIERMKSEQPTDVPIPNSAVNFETATPIYIKDMINLDYLNNNLSNYADKNGNKDEEFLVADGVADNNALTTTQADNIISNLNKSGLVYKNLKIGGNVSILPIGNGIMYGAVYHIVSDGERYLYLFNGSDTNLIIHDTYNGSAYTREFTNISGEHMQVGTIYDGRYVYGTPYVNKAVSPNEGSGISYVFDSYTHNEFSIDLSLGNPNANTFHFSTYIDGYIYHIPSLSPIIAVLNTNNHNDISHIDITDPDGNGLVHGITHDGSFIYVTPNNGNYVRKINKNNHTDIKFIKAPATLGIDNFGFRGAVCTGKDIYTVSSAIHNKPTHINQAIILKMNIETETFTTIDVQLPNIEMSYNMGPFDGRYIYITLWYSTPFTKKILILDTLDDSFEFIDYSHLNFTPSRLGIGTLFKDQIIFPPINNGTENYSAVVIPAYNLRDKKITL